MIPELNQRIQILEVQLTAFARNEEKYPREVAVKLIKNFYEAIVTLQAAPQEFLKSSQELVDAHKKHVETVRGSAKASTESALSFVGMVEQMTLQVKVFREVGATDEDLEAVYKLISEQVGQRITEADFPRMVQELRAHAAIAALDLAAAEAQLKVVELEHAEYMKYHERTQVLVMKLEAYKTKYMPHSGN